MTHILQRLPAKGSFYKNTAYDKKIQGGALGEKEKNIEAMYCSVNRELHTTRHKKKWGDS